ncbi:MAG: hypothetical protein M3N14_07940 [Bacteroidota bacterium]|nr:hypothetical protein [Bacteroidota bacterium]
MATKNNTINITACDNEIIILAYQDIAGSEVSFELCRVSSGFNYSVAVNLTLAAGPYKDSLVLNGVSGPLSKTATLYLPAGPYKLLLMGINWGGGQQFVIDVNGTTHGILKYQPTPGAEGLTYHSSPIAISV